MASSSRATQNNQRARCSSLFSLKFHFKINIYSCMYALTNSVFWNSLSLSWSTRIIIVIAIVFTNDSKISQAKTKVRHYQHSNPIKSNVHERMQFYSIAKFFVLCDLSTSIDMHTYMNLQASRNEGHKRSINEQNREKNTSFYCAYTRVL